MIEVKSRGGHHASALPLAEDNLESHGTHMKKKKLKIDYKNSVNDTSEQSNCDGTKSNQHGDDFNMDKYEPSFTGFGHSPIKRKKLKDEPRSYKSGNFFSTEHSSTLSRMKDSQEFNRPVYIDYVHEKTLVEGEIQNTNGSKKKKRKRNIFDEEELKNTAAEHFVFDESSAIPRKKRKKNSKTLMVDEGALSCDEQVHSIMDNIQENEERFTSGHKDKEENVTVDREFDDLNSRKAKKKKKREDRRIPPVFQVDNFVQEVQYCECNDVTNGGWKKKRRKKKKKEREILQLQKECQEDVQNHNSDESISKVCEEHENGQDEKLRTSGLSEIFHGERNSGKKEREFGHPLDQCKLSAPKRSKKKKNLNLSGKKNDRESSGISSPDCIPSTVINEGFGFDVQHLPLKAVKNSNTNDINKTEENRRKLFSEEHIVHVDVSPLNESSNSIKKKKQSKVQAKSKCKAKFKDMDSLFDRSEHNLTLTEGTVDQITDEATPINIKRNNEYVEEHANKVTRTNDTRGKEEKDVHAKEILDFCNVTAEKTVKKKKSKSYKELERTPDSQDVYDRHDTVRTSPVEKEKKSSAGIHDENGKLYTKTKFNKSAPLSEISAAVSGSEAEVSLMTPNSKHFTRRRSGSNKSLRKDLGDPQIQSNRKTSESEVCQEELPIGTLFEPIVTITSEERPFVPIEPDISEITLFSDESSNFHSPNREDKKFKSERFEEDFLTYEDVKNHLNGRSEEQADDERTYNGHFLLQDSLLSRTPRSRERKFECEVCHRKFRLRHHLERHMSTHTPRSVRALTCKVCDKQYVSKKGLARHIETHTTKKYKCYVCNEKFFHLSHVRSHAAVHEVHQGGLMFKCDFCNKSFLSKKSLNGHLAAHVLKQHNCDMCGKKFSYRSHLDQHMAVHSAKENRVYECEHCVRKFRSRQNLHDHLSRVHGKKEYECSQCNRKFYLLRQLKHHMIIHSEQRPYDCEPCRKAFKRKNDRKNHCWHHLMEENAFREREPRKFISDAEDLDSTNMLSEDESELFQKVISDVWQGSVDGWEGGSCDGVPDEISKDDSEKGEEVNGYDETEDYRRCTCCRRNYRGGDELRCHSCILRNKTMEKNGVRV